MSSDPQFLTLKTPSIHDGRTLIWLQQQAPTVDWSKWDGIVTSMADYQFWSIRKATLVGIALSSFPEDCEDLNAWLEELYYASKKVSTLFLSQRVLSLKSEAYWSENFDNVINLDMIATQYPFMEKPWDGTDADAVVLYALLSRYNRVIDCMTQTVRNVYELTFEHHVHPPAIWLITQFFRHPSKKRTAELKECLARNCACPHIDQIMLLNERDYSKEWQGIPGWNKIKQVIIQKRITYIDFLQFVKEHVPSSTYVILCNADIYMGDSLLHLWKMKMESRMIALLRWDDLGDGKIQIFGPRSDSQDTWIMLSDSVKQQEWDSKTFSFQLGQAGCDNAFAAYMLRKRFLLLNPALTFKTFHIHNSNIRNYDPKDPIRAPLYINIAPTYLIDTKQDTVPELPPPHHLSHRLITFRVHAASVPDEITYCTMLERGKEYVWKPSVENHYFQAAIPVYEIDNACVTPNGLIYDLYRIYMGKHADDPQYQYWRHTKMNIFTPLQKHSQMMAIPFATTEIFEHSDRYVLEYVSRATRLLTLYPAASYWFPVDDRFQAIQWTKTDQCVPFSEDTACWADHVVGFMPGPLLLGPEDIDALRKRLLGWKEQPIEKKCCVVVDDTIITPEFVKKSMKTCFPTWDIQCVQKEDVGCYDAILGAEVCVFFGGKQQQLRWAKLWALPRGCEMIEFQMELDLDGEFQHLAHVAELNSRIFLLGKGSTKDIQDQLMDELIDHTTLE